MSDLHVALVAEGPTDAVVIEAALRALLPRPFVLTRLQPEPTRPRLGTGWGGVLRWCREFASRGQSSLEAEPTLPGFDLFVLHVDADVAGGSYADVSDEFATLATQQGWPSLPNASPCPPPDGSSDHMRRCLLSWSGLEAAGPRTVLCVPSKAIDAWLVAARFEDGHKLLGDLECNLRLEAQLGGLPKAERVKKTVRGYHENEKLITSQWSRVRQRCSQAERFSNAIARVEIP